MNRKIAIILTVALLMISGVSVAQQHGGGGGQHNIKNSTMKGSMVIMQANMGMMADITAKLYQMMSKGHMSPHQRQQSLEMMNQMSRIMKEMSVPHGEQVKQRHQRELQDMRKKLDT